MAGVQIFTESPISTAVKNEKPTTTTTTTTAEAPQPAAAPIPSTKPVPRSGPYAPQPAPFLPPEPAIDPPTPTVSSHQTSNYAPPTIPQRSGSLTPSVPASPQPSASLDAPSFPRSRSASPRRDIPPPPKAGEKMKPASYYSPAATPTTYPSQTAHYPQQTFPQQTGQTPSTATFAQQQQGLLSPHPNGIFSPAGYTMSPAQTPTTATMPSAAGAASKTSFEHPPGYVQNPYAADMTPEQRFAASKGMRSPTLGYNSTPSAAGFSSPNPFASFAGNQPLPSPGVSTGGGNRGILDNGADDGSVWGMVSGWAKTAGKKMSEAEGEIWKRINRE